MVIKKTGKGVPDDLLQDPAKIDMKKNTKKMAATAAAVSFVGAMALGGTMAYLTDGETVTNTFTVGNVTADLVETNKPDESMPRVPNEEMEKNPRVINNGSNAAVMFMAVDVPMERLETVGYDGTSAGENLVELLGFRKKGANYPTGDSKPTVHDGWILVSSEQTVEADGKAKKTYIYGYHAPILGDKHNFEKVDMDRDGTFDFAGVESKDVPPLFDYVRLANVIEGPLDNEKLNMDIRVYAIQAAFLQNADNTLNNHNIKVSDDMTKDTLKPIYDIFAGQNPQAVQGDAIDAGAVVSNPTIADANEHGDVNVKGDTLN